MIPLTFAPEGSIVRVVELNVGRGLERRLYELGIFRGSLIKVVKTRGPGPVLIEVLGNTSWSVHSTSRLALGYGVAMKIFVEVVSSGEKG